MKFEIKSIPLGSIVFSPLPIVLLLVGIIGGLVAFVFAPSPLMEPMTAMTRMTGTGVFALVYMLLVLCVILISAFLYNVFCAGLGLRGVRVQLEEVEDDSDEEPAA
jgi:cytochrome c oxidase assembly protein Cox11